MWDWRATTDVASDFNGGFLATRRIVVANNLMGTDVGICSIVPIFFISKQDLIWVCLKIDLANKWELYCRK